MEKTKIIPLQERTNAKLRYARVHLDELKSQGQPSGNDFDRAHQESFLFHLFGTRDAFLAELNHYYQTELAPEALSLNNIRVALKKQSITSSEVRILYELEHNDTSWYSQAKIMRDHSTHIQGVQRAYFMGGENHQKVKLKHPKTGILTERDFILEFENWLTEMESLIRALRASALSTMGSKSFSGE